jgi:tripartite-type tricarboxylate transporter receptor subunit TctC
VGVNVLIENQGGAGGKIAFEKFQKTEPNGYSLILSTFPKSITMEYIEKVNYRTKDFVPVFAWSRTNPLLAVHVETWRTFEDFLKAAKAKVLAGGVSARTGPTYIAGLIAMSELGVKFNFVPFEGAAGSLVAVAGKHLDFTISLSTTATSLIDAGKLRPLLLFGNKRDPYLPDVPVPHELGFNISSFPAIRGVMAPPNTPAPIVKVLEEAFSKVVKDPGYVDWAKRRKMAIEAMDAHGFGKILMDAYPQVEKFQHLLKE